MSARVPVPAPAPQQPHTQLPLASLDSVQGFWHCSSEGLRPRDVLGLGMLL